MKIANHNVLLRRNESFLAGEVFLFTERLINVFFIYRKINKRAVVKKAATLRRIPVSPGVRRAEECEAAKVGQSSKSEERVVARSKERA